MRIFLTLALLFPVRLFACINSGMESESPILKAGGDNAAAIALQHSIDTDPRTLTYEKKFGPPKTPEQKKQAAAVNKMLAGDQAGAIELLTKMERENPGQYATASNLGTAYELSGDNAKALEWITEAVRRNPPSHGDTEWLHVLILEAKIKLEKDPGALQKESVLKVSEGIQVGGTATVNGRALSVHLLRRALAFQLEERLVFVKPKDPVVADLLYNYALLEGNTVAAENGLGLLALARLYGFPREERINEQEAIFRTATRPYAIKHWLTVIYSTIGVFVVVLLGYTRNWFSRGAAGGSTNSRSPQVSGRLT